MIIEPDTYRKFTRIPFDGQVKLEFISDSYEDCRIKDVSLAGMFIKGDFQQHESKHCNINLVSTSMVQGSTLQGLAKVVRKNDEGIAVEFTSMQLESYFLLLTTLLNESKDILVNTQLLTEECPFEVTDDFTISSEYQSISFH